jgi:hypothetical protein
VEFALSIIKLYFDEKQIWQGCIGLFKTKRNDMQRQMIIDKVRENKSVFENWGMKKRWETEIYNCCNMREMRQCSSGQGLETGNSEQGQKDDDTLTSLHTLYVIKLHILLKCAGTKSSGGKFLNNKWLNIKTIKQRTKKIISCINNIQLENLPTFSITKCKWQSQVKKNVQNFKRKANYCK